MSISPTRWAARACAAHKTILASALWSCDALNKLLFVWQHGTPPLLIAAGCGNIQIIEVLMRKGAEIQAGDKVKSLWGVNCVTQLLEQASQLQHWRKRIVHLHKQTEHKKNFLFFKNLQSGANAIYYAARHGHVETLKFLHIKKCPLDIQDKVNQVPTGLPLCVYVIQTCSKVHKCGLLLSRLGFLSTSNRTHLFQTSGAPLPCFFKTSRHTDSRSPRWAPGEKTSYSGILSAYLLLL